MLYAQIIIAQRTAAQELTYLVPERIIPYIKIGSLVTVPVRNKKVLGVVTDYKKNVPSDLKPKIKEILAIEKGKVISENLITLFQKLSDKYFCSLAQVAHMALTSEIFGENKNSSKFEQIYVQGPLEFRIEQYEAKLKEAGAGLVIFPTKELASNFKKINKVKGVVVGTIGDIFAPLNSNAIVIIDSPNHIGSYNERRPYLSSKQVALERAQIENRTLIIGESVLSVSDIYKISTQKNQIISKIIESDYLVVDTQKHSLINETLLENLHKAHEEQQKVIIILPPQTSGGAMFCTNCKKLQLCSKCKRPVNLIEKNIFRCNYCAHEVELTKCYNCKSEKLIELGFNPKNAQQTINSVVKGNDFVFTKETELQRCDMAVLLGYDRSLTSTNYDQTAKLLNFLIELQALAKRIIIQTKFPEHPLWGNITASKLKQLLKLELQTRKRYELPPYGGYFELIGLGNVEEEVSQITEQLELLGCSVSPLKNLKGNKSVLEVYYSKRLDFKELLSKISPSWQIKFTN